MPQKNNVNSSKSKVKKTTLSIIFKKSFSPQAFYDGIMRQMSLNWKDILTWLCVLTGKYIKIIKLRLGKKNSFAGVIGLCCFAVS